MAFEFFISNLVTSFSYLGVFAAAGIVSASIVFPLPAYLIIVAAVALKLDPILTSIMYGAGSMMGELICYNIGVAGNKATDKTVGKWLRFKTVKKLMEWTKRNFHKHGFLTIFITALIIFPFDFVSIIAGASGYSIKKYLIAGFLGKFLKTWVLMILTIMGATFLGFLV